MPEVVIQLLSREPRIRTLAGDERIHANQPELVEEPVELSVCVPRRQIQIKDQLPRQRCLSEGVVEPPLPGVGEDSPLIAEDGRIGDALGGLLVGNGDTERLGFYGYPRFAIDVEPIVKKGLAIREVVLELQVVDTAVPERIEERVQEVGARLVASFSFAPPGCASRSFTACSTFRTWLAASVFVATSTLLTLMTARLQESSPMGVI